MLIEFYFTPELHLKDGRIIRDLNDAASFAANRRCVLDDLIERGLRRLAAEDIATRRKTFVCHRANWHERDRTAAGPRPTVLA
jgi:hypothetical protein